MSNVPIRELRNDGGLVADRVLAGEYVIVTRAGKPIMDLTALPKAPLSATALLARWRHLDGVDIDRLRRDANQLPTTRLMLPAESQQPGHTTRSSPPLPSTAT